MFKACGLGEKNINGFRCFGAVYNGVHIGGHEAYVVHGLHIPADLGSAGLGNSDFDLAMHTVGRRRQDRQQQNIINRQGSRHNSA